MNYFNRGSFIVVTTVASYEPSAPKNAVRKIYNKYSCKDIDSRSFLVKKEAFRRVVTQNTCDVIFRTMNTTGIFFLQVDLRETSQEKRRSISLLNDFLLSH